MNDADDGFDLRIMSHEIRQELSFPESRQHKDYQLLIMHIFLNTKASIHKINKFSLWLLDLLKVFDHPGNFFCWFHTSILPYTLDLIKFFYPSHWI